MWAVTSRVGVWLPRFRWRWAVVSRGPGMGVGQANRPRRLRSVVADGGGAADRDPAAAELGGEGVRLTEHLIAPGDHDALPLVPAAEC